MFSTFARVRQIGAPLSAPRGQARSRHSHPLDQLSRVAIFVKKLPNLVAHPDKTAKPGIAVQSLVKGVKRWQLYGSRFGALR